MLQIDAVDAVVQMGVPTCDLSDHLVEEYEVYETGENGIIADQELVKTALQNLIDNAVKYSLTDSEIQIDVTDSTFTVSNRAEPMTADELRQLWKPYVRKHKSRRKGNGLGLSIVKSILDLHGAKYHMEMKENTLRCQIIFNR